MAETTPSASEAEFVDELYRTYIHFLLGARTGAGTWSGDDRLSSFMVYLDDPVRIVINDEPFAWTMTRALRSGQEGDTLELSDLGSDQVERPAHEPPYAGAELSEDGWKPVADFRTCYRRTIELLSTGGEFLSVARGAYEVGSLRAFVENAFHAAESFAKAELLTYPILAVELETSSKHAHVQSVYDLWLRLENTDARFPAVLRQLTKLRADATYGDHPFSLDSSDATTILTTLDALATHATSMVHDSPPRTIRIIATRDIEAGKLVSNEDITIRPAPRVRRQD
jgi:hypothetical protein